MQYIIHRSKKNISWEIKMKRSETKNIVLFNQRQNINVKDWKENKTRIKISEFYKWYSSNTVDIKLARYFIFSLFFLLTSEAALSAIFQPKALLSICIKATDYPDERYLLIHRWLF